MATLKIEPAAEGKVWVSLTRFRDADLARLKAIPGRRWDPERKQWQFPDMPETRAALAEIVRMPSSPPPTIAVRPKQANAPASKKPYKRYMPGRDRP